MDEQLLQPVLAYVQSFFAGDASGHDVQHTLRVWRMARRIAKEEGADSCIVQLAALLHDVDDRKISPLTCESKANAVAFMEEQGVNADIIRQVVDIISDVSYSGGKVPACLEGKIVQDADRLDAMGAIGIARTFAFGGSRGRAMHDPEGKDSSTSVAHFHDKLLKLKEGMHTATGKQLAEQRHRYMEMFLQEFEDEWNGVK